MITFTRNGQQLTGTVFRPRPSGGHYVDVTREVIEVVETLENGRTVVSYLPPDGVSPTVTITERYVLTDEELSGGAG